MFPTVWALPSAWGNNYGHETKTHFMFCFRFVSRCTARWDGGNTWTGELMTLRRSSPSVRKSALLTRLQFCEFVTRCGLTNHKWTAKIEFHSIEAGVCFSVPDATCYITAKIRPRRYFVPVKLERVNESNLQIHQMNYIDGCPCPVVVKRKSTSALRKSRKHCAHNASPCDHFESGPYTLLWNQLFVLRLSTEQFVKPKWPLRRCISVIYCVRWFRHRSYHVDPAL
jgi:hypothetical protein